MRIAVFLTLVFSSLMVATQAASAATVTGRVLDDATGMPIAARIYLSDEGGQYFHVGCPSGSAVSYNSRRADSSYEVHTTVSAHPFRRTELPAGKYTLLVEKGKEYHPTTRDFVVSADKSHNITIRLKRWINMASLNWFCGETHVHREVTELPTLQIAEDVNVAFPLTAWVTDSAHTPERNNKNPRQIPPARLVKIDDTHVFWPINTEYEIFSVRGQRHTLGAVFILNHREPFDVAAPPVGPIASEARRQGGFLELDKHNWPWSIMLMPQMKVDLFELANNHIWRTNFLFSDWYPEYYPDYLDNQPVDGHFTERAWIHFGFETFYAFLNCGFAMQPTAGTASGVHPVPFGYGRVYVHLPERFSYESWIDGLLSGHSFVTTGPMLFSTAIQEDQSIRVTGRIESQTPPLALEVIVNGSVAHRQELSQTQSTEGGVFRVPFDIRIPFTGTSWVAVRVFATRPGDRISFAHSAPTHFAVPGSRLKPTRQQRDYLVKRVRDEIERNQGVLTDEALSEFEAALTFFESLSVSDDPN